MGDSSDHIDNLAFFTRSKVTTGFVLRGGKPPVGFSSLGKSSSAGAARVRVRASCFHNENMGSMHENRGSIHNGFNS